MSKQIFLPKHLNFHQCINLFTPHDSIFILPMHQHTNFTMHQPSIIPMVHPQIVLCITLFTHYGTPPPLPMHHSLYFLWFTLLLSTASGFLYPCYNTQPMPFISNIYLYPNCPALPPLAKIKIRECSR